MPFVHIRDGNTLVQHPEDNSVDPIDLGAACSGVAVAYPGVMGCVRADGTGFVVVRPDGSTATLALSATANGQHAATGLVADCGITAGMNKALAGLRVADAGEGQGIVAVALVDLATPCVEAHKLPLAALPAGAGQIAQLLPLGAGRVALVTTSGEVYAWDLGRAAVEAFAPRLVVRAVGVFGGGLRLRALGVVKDAASDAVDMATASLCAVTIERDGTFTAHEPVAAGALDAERVPLAPTRFHQALWLDANTCVLPQSQTTLVLGSNGTFQRSDDGALAPPAAVGAFVADANAAAFDATCAICFDDLDPTDGSVVTLDCGHQFHKDCVGMALAAAEKYLPKGHRILFNMAQCPSGCGCLIRHPLLAETARIADRYSKVVADVEPRAQLEYPNEKAEHVLGSYLHYVCGTCGEPYWGGNKDCAAMMSGEADCDPKSLVCERCNTDFVCPTHQREFVVYKCAYCCNPATHFSIGRLRLCDACVDGKRKRPLLGDDAAAACDADACPFAAAMPMPHRNEQLAVGCWACLGDLVDVRRVRQPSAEAEE